MPSDASAAAQADVHICLLNALWIPKAAVLGGSAGAPSALQMAIRHPDRTSALILLVPLTYKPPTQAASAPTMPSWAENTMMSVIGSDFLFWAALHVARDLLIGTVLATPPEVVGNASAVEQARVNAMLDNILPVSARAAGLRSDTAASKHLSLASLASVRAATLTISVRDDCNGTFASAEFTVRNIAGARFIRFARGGHTWLNDHIIAQLRRCRGRPPHHGKSCRIAGKRDRRRNRGAGGHGGETASMAGHRAAEGWRLDSFRVGARGGHDRRLATPDAP